MSPIYLYTNEASRNTLLDDSQKIILIGGDFGYGNFGDVLQHINSLNIARKSKRFSTVSVMAANAIGFKEFPEWAKQRYGTDAIIFVADYPLILAEDSPALVPLGEIRNLSVVHLYGGGFLNNMWGDFVLNVTEYFLNLTPESTYLASGQQITHPYQTRVAQHVEAYKPALFGVRDELSRQWLSDAGFNPQYSFDDATEALIGLTEKLQLKRGAGLLMHINGSDYTGRGKGLKGLEKDLKQLSGHTGKTSTITLLQAFRDSRHEVNDSLETLKQLDFKFPFSDIRLIGLAALAYGDDSQSVLEPIQGDIGYSCSYHVALWLQLAGIPCWLRSNNPFYDQKSSALQVTQGLESFLDEPLLADHRINLEKRAQWRAAFDKALESAPEVRQIINITPCEGGPTPWPFFFKGRPSVDERLISAQEHNRNLVEQLERLSTQQTEVSHEAHTQRKRTEAAEERARHTEITNRELVVRIDQMGERCNQIFQSRSWRLTRPLRALARFVAHGRFDSKGQIGLFGAALRIGRSLRILPIMRTGLGTLLEKFRRQLVQSKFNFQSLRARLRIFYHWLPLSQRVKWRVREYLFPLLGALQTDRSLSGIARGITAVISSVQSGSVTLRDDNREHALACILAKMAEHAQQFGPVRHWIALPFLATGGAEMVALNHCRALRELLPGHSVLLLTTDRVLVSEHMAMCSGVLRLALDDYLTDDHSYEQKQALLKDMIIAVRPFCFHNINSEVAWRLILDEGERLKRFTHLFASIFAFQFAPDGHKKIGYAAYFLKKGIPHLSGLFSDNRRFLTDATLEYQLTPEEQSRLELLYQPCRLLSSDIREKGLERLLRRRTANEKDSTLARVRPQVLWAGRLDAEKRIDLFLEVVRSCTFADFRVFGQVVLGDGETLPTLPNLSYEGPFSSPLEWLEHFDFDAFVFTSRWEGMPNILIEVGALGIPVIAPTVGGVGELITESTGYPLPERPTATDYEKALRCVVNDPVQSIQRADRLFDLVQERHSWDSFVVSVDKVPDYTCSAFVNLGVMNRGSNVVVTDAPVISDLPLVSVIIPCYNQGHYLQESVSSALAACRHPLEIIIVDDGSTDPHASRYLSEAEQLAPEIIRIHCQDNRGLSSARNTGIALARGRFIQFLDADDVLVPGKIDAQISQLQINPDLMVSVCNYLLCNADRSQFSKSEEAIARFDLTEQDFLYRWERGFVIPIHCALFNRALLYRVQFDTHARAKEDWLFWSSLAIEGTSFGYIHYHGAIYRQHTASMRRSYVNMGQAWLQAGLKINDMVADGEPLFFESVVSWFEQCYRLNPEYRAEIAQRMASAVITADTSAMQPASGTVISLAAQVQPVADAILSALTHLSYADQPPLLSVIVPIYCHFKHLQGCLESLALQGDVSIEVVCIDDCSPDPRVTHLMQALQGKNPRLNVKIETMNRGISIAQNFAVNMARGEYIAFLDCDDALTPCALQVVKNVLLSQPDVDYLFTDRIDVDGEDRVVRIARYGGYDQLHFSHQDRIAEDLFDGMVASHLKVIRRQVYQTLGGCNTAFSGVQDWELALRISRTHKLYYLAQPLYRHRIHGQSITSSDTVSQFRKTNQARRIHLEASLREAESNVRPAKVFLTRDLPVSLDVLKESWKRGEICVADLRGTVNIGQINFLREYNSYFDRILWSDPQVPAALYGYLCKETILSYI